MADPRIPLTLLPDDAALSAWLAVGGAAAVLAERAAAAPGAVAVEPFATHAPHRFGCACCAGRSGVAIALDRLFQARARGRCAWFDRVGVLAESPAARGQLAAALAGDALTMARFRAA